MQQSFRFAWSAGAEQPRPATTTSPFLKQWRAWHKSTCAGHGERVHVWHGMPFGDAPSGLYTDLECLGCGDHYREAK